MNKKVARFSVKNLPLSQVRKNSSKRGRSMPAFGATSALTQKRTNCICTTDFPGYRAVLGKTLVGLVGRFDPVKPEERAAAKAKEAAAVSTGSAAK